MPDDTHFDDSRPPTEEEWGTPLVEPQSDPEVERAFRRRMGIVSGAVPYVVPHPWLYRPFLYLACPSIKIIDGDFAAALSFIIARDNSCRFCYSTFRTLLRLSNYSSGDLRDLEANFSMQDFSAGEEWGLRLAVRLSRGDGVPEALDQLREQGVSKTTIREIAGVSVLSLVNNRIGTTLSIPVSTFEEMADRWYLRPWRVLAMPLIKWSQRLRADTETLSDEASDGMLGRWVRTLRGTPTGRVVQDMTEQWLASEQSFSTRIKLLMLAVVARGLSATALEEHLQAHLQEEYDLSEERFETAINHLGGTAVEEEEKRLLRLARASIRYDFGPIKRIAWECTQDFDRAGTMEAIASISIANALARLEMLFPLEDE